MKKKLIVKQVDESDCGACCLLSIIRYYQGNVPLEILKIETNTDKDGTNAYELIKCANKYGLEGSGHKVNNINDLIFPVIAHIKLENDYYHFVVVYKLNKNYLEIMDPALGKIKIREEEFLKIFTGNIINLKPFTNVLYLKKDTTFQKIIYKIIKNNKKEIIKYYLIYMFLLLISILFSLIIKLLLNNKSLILFSLLFFLLLLIKIILTYHKNKKESSVQNLLKLNINNNFFTHILSLPQKYIQMKTNGEILTRFKELDFIVEFVCNFIFKNILELFSILIIFIILSFYNIKISICLLMFICIYTFISIFYNKFLSAKIIKQLNNESEYTSKLNEYINSTHTIKLLNNNNFFLKNYNEIMCNKFKNNLKFEKSLNISEIIKDGIYYVTYFFSIIFSFYINIDIIDIITYLNIEVILLDNLKSFLNDLPLFTYQKNIFIKISEFFSIEEEKDNKLIYNLENDITLKNVSFSYNNKEVFKYNFHINKNEHIMIKGKNGCGKSTLCKILTGMINEYDGKVLLNEKNILDLEPNFLRTIISFSDQKAQLFNDTIKNNITLGIEYDNKLFEKVCNICELETIVEKKTNRYNSIIYEGCPNLSGGEIQKIILARTLIRKSKIIILDETLSEVNIESEIEIIKKINKELKNKTIIYITHKNLEKYFDKIIHLN